MAKTSAERRQITALNKQSYMLYTDMNPQIQEMTDPEAGFILKSVSQYATDGTEPDTSKADRFISSFWKSLKIKIDTQRKKEAERSEQNSANAKAKYESERMRSDANESERMRSDANAPTIHNNNSTCTVHDYNSTCTSTEQETEKKIFSADADRDGTAAAALGAAPPPGGSVGDLFTVSKLSEIAEEKDIPIDADGIAAFWEEMHAAGWILYGRPVEKKTITRAVRGWLNYHPEFEASEDSATDPAEAEPELTQAMLKQDKNLRDRLVQSICKKVNERNGTAFSADGDGLRNLVDYLRAHESVLTASNLFTETELMAMWILWDIDV